jgi:Ubiquitin fusion degradation protein UFD1
MDFENAARRFAREQKSSRNNNRTTGIAGAGVGSGAALSAKAKREAEERKTEQAQRLEERRQRQRRLEFLQQYMRQCDRSLGVKSLLSASAAAATTATSTVGSTSLQLQATSIHGEGDKIALPPSVLEYLTRESSQSNISAANEQESLSFQGPWTFRIGILNPKYDVSSFPASPLLQALKIPNDDESQNDDDDDMDTDDDESENDEENNVNSHHNKAAYLDELDYKYLAYTHGTVVEFTQDENCVGLPQPIAAALLAKNSNIIPIKRTVDPASSAKHRNVVVDGIVDEEEEEEQMNVQDDDDDDQKELTPGHLAYGAFDIPDLPIEISLVQLPKGRACTLTPTVQAVQDGFYNLNNVKLVLEQSLIRTRATLSVGDTVHTWHRGVKFDLRVSKVTPSTYRAIRCINTDLEVDFGHVEMSKADPTPTISAPAAASSSESSGGFTLSGGRVLSSMAAASVPVEPAAPRPIATTGTNAVNVEKLLQSLPDEPPPEQTQGVCTVQIRGSGAGGKSGRRRFHVEKTTVHDLFTFAKSILAAASAQEEEASTMIPPFRLVTRMPRRVLEDPSTGINKNAASSTLSQAGVQEGRELFMIEFL